MYIVMSHDYCSLFKGKAKAVCSEHINITPLMQLYLDTTAVYQHFLYFWLYFLNCICSKLLLLRYVIKVSVNELTQ